ncbi:MAG: DUF3320 domain-containing protein [Planctomycetaceae bacterium]|nr:DUF3320 domain-containing protein [Planctomycetaceae bacterium]
MDPWFTDAVPEPVFVKNLENVQGDERDVILFSVCYGPDDAGRVAMNFGPLNRDGGERRLNVAVTRAREQVVVFSSIGPEAIDLSRTRARGVADLKTFLDYAGRGTLALHAAASGGAGEAESPLESSVAAALRGRGWEVDLQVGCSGYRIDLAVKDPGRPGEYLAGIECDGASYHSARTARDRDRLREQVLRRLGWNLLRVWSTDWWYEPGKVLDRLDGRLAELKDAAGVRGRDPLELGNTNPRDPAAAGAEEDPTPPRPPGAPKVVGPVAADLGEGVPVVEPVLPGQSEYRVWTGPGKQGGPEDFHEFWNGACVAGLLKDLVAVEGPISFDLAARRLGALWEIDRVTSKVRARLREAHQYYPGGVRIEGEFLWPAEVEAGAWGVFRVPGGEEGDFREAEDIPPEEAANAAAGLLRGLVSLPRKDLVRAMGRLFGFQRLGRRVEERMEEGIALLAARGGCEIAGEAVRLPRG